MSRATVGSGRLPSLLAVGLAGLLAQCGDSGVMTPTTPTNPLVIHLSSTSATFGAATGGAIPPAQSVSVTNGGGGTLAGLNTSVTYPAGQPSAWLTASLSSTTAPAVLRLSAAASNLAVGTYTAAVGVVASGANNSPQSINVTLSVAPCPAMTILAAGQYTAIDPLATQGCVAFPANGSVTDPAEYLLVPQAATEVPDLATSFTLMGGTAAPVAPLAAALQPVQVSAASQFHDRLRELERTRAYSSGSDARVALPRAAPAPSSADTLGNRRAFKVLSSISVLQLATVRAIARSAGQHVVLYVDSAAPAGGFSTADYDKMRSDFDTLLYAADTTAFGRESDIDGNGRVIVLMTNVVNRLVTTQQCQTSGYVAGFFFGADIDPVVAPQYNNGEIFYSIVADPNGTLSCAHSSSGVNQVIPATFIHEFQHLISFNQHVLLRGGEAEVLWLNEGMSHYAEELGGRVFLQAGDSTRFCEHVLGDLFNFGLYLADPEGYALVDTVGIGGLAQRGAYWAFVRYLVDQFAADTSLAAAAAFTRRLEQTALTGTTNVAQVTGVPFATLAQRWVLANWVSDLSGFTAPPALRYKHWAFRTAFPALHTSCSTFLPATFPLAASVSPGTSVYMAGTMATGSAGGYERAQQGPGGPGFTVAFGDALGGQLAGTVLPRLNVLRIR